MRIETGTTIGLEMKDEPFKVYEAAMAAGSPSAAHVAMKACEAAKATGIGTGTVKIGAQEVEVHLTNPVPRCHGLRRSAPLPMPDEECMALCDEMSAWAVSRRMEAAEYEAGERLPQSVATQSATPAVRTLERLGGASPRKGA